MQPHIFRVPQKRAECQRKPGMVSSGEEMVVPTHSHLHFSLLLPCALSYANSNPHPRYRSVLLLAWNWCMDRWAEMAHQAARRWWR